MNMPSFATKQLQDLTKKGEDKAFGLEIKNECNNTSLSVFIQPIKGLHRNPIIGIDKNTTKRLTLPSDVSKITIKNFWEPGVGCKLGMHPTGTIKVSFHPKV